MAQAPSTPVAQLPADAVLLDVREDEEFAAGHAPGALHVPLGQLPARVAELPDAPVHVLCRTGGRAAEAAQWLVDRGRAATVVEGGTRAWVESGRPLVAEAGGDAAQPRVL